MHKSSRGERKFTLPARLFPTLGLSTLVAALLLASGLIFPSVARSECQTFPIVPWWGEITPRSVTNYVNHYYAGDWQPFIDMHQTHLSKLLEIRKLGKEVAVNPIGKGRRRIILDATGLDGYIGDVKKRLAILNCLARRDGETEPPALEQQASNSSIAAADKDAASWVGKIIKLGCKHCHGETGISKNHAIPKLAGQNPLYLSKQLQRFKFDSPQEGGAQDSDVRFNKIMQGRAQGLNDEDIGAIVAYFAGQSACAKGGGGAKPAPPPRPQSAEKCIECHGDRGKTASPEIPKLAGQHKVYLLRQFKAFAAKQSSARTKANIRHHSIMSSLIKDLSDTELSELADYFSRQGC